MSLSFLVRSVSGLDDIFEHSEQSILIFRGKVTFTSGIVNDLSDIKSFYYSLFTFSCSKPP